MVERRRPIIRARCTSCGLKLVGELHANGTLFVSRHPERVEGDERPMVCLDCIGARQGVLARVPSKPSIRGRRVAPRAAERGQ